MTPDAFLKKYFLLAIAVLVALVCYFQARGAGALVGASLLPSSILQVADLIAVASGPQRSTDRASATPLIERNPFDSVTGPLNPNPPVTLPSPAKEEPPPISDPLSVAQCGGVKVMIVTESDDPTWSFAALQGPGEDHPQLRRVGDSLGAMKVEYIGFNPMQASPAVWLTNAGQLCQALLFAAEPPPAAATAPSPGPAEAAPPVPPPAGGAGAVSDDIKSKIVKVSDTEFNVDRAVVDKILENQAELMKSARIVPEQKDGKVVGIRLFGIRPDTLLGTLGLQNGDRLESINGFNMASPEKALEAYARLRTANNLNVKVNRRGQPMSIDFRIK